MNITGNTVFIPGATSGIGLALARRFKDRGNTVIIGGRRVEILNQLKEQDGFDTVEIDTADPRSITTAAERVISAHPGLNVVLPWPESKSPRTGTPRTVSSTLPSRLWPRTSSDPCG